jgi:hypothetical protein
MDAAEVIDRVPDYSDLLVSEQDEMLPWLAQAAKALRRAGGRKTVNIGSSLGMSESTISRFENAKGWPERPDQMVAAYADDLDVDAIDIWARALELWRAATVDDRTAVEEETEERAQQSERTVGASLSKTPDQPQKVRRPRKRP